MKPLEHNHCTQVCASQPGTHLRNAARVSAIFPLRTLAGVAGLLMLSAAQLAGATEQLDLQGTTITGNRELPKALHIVPWKAAEAGELAGRPLNSLVEELLEPIDRDVFLKELEYYEAVHSSR